MYRQFVIASVVTAMAWPAGAQTSDDLKFCAGLRSSKERLACYDAAARLDSPHRRRVADVPQVVANASAAVPPTRATSQAPSAWQGFYVGAAGGWAQKDDREARILIGVGYSATSFSESSSHIQGWVAGGHVGYNTQIGQLVFGVVGDAAAANIYRTVSINQSANAFSISVRGQVQQTTEIWQTSGTVRADFLGTVRAKIGLDVGGVALLYATGGLAFLHNMTESTVVPLTPLQANSFALQTTGSGSVFQFGYAGGLGAEVKLGDNWSAFAEYVFTRFAPKSVPMGLLTATLQPDFHVARGGVTYWFR